MQYQFAPQMAGAPVLQNADGVKAAITLSGTRMS